MAQNRELMRAVIMENIGGPRVLNYVRLARPVPGCWRGSGQDTCHLDQPM